MERWSELLEAGLVVLVAAFISYRNGMLDGLYLLGVATCFVGVLNFHRLRRMEAEMRSLKEVMEVKPR